MKKARKYTYDWLTSLEGKYSAYTIQTRAKGIGKYYGITPTDKVYYTPPVRHRESITRSRLRTKTDAHVSEERNSLLLTFCRCTGLRRSGIESIKHECLFDKALLHDEYQRLRSIPENSLTQDEIELLQCISKIEVFRGFPQYYIYVTEKGGKKRLAPIFGSDEEVQKVVDKINSTAPGHRVWGKVSKNIDIHHCRGMYAANIYRHYARNIDDIPYDKQNKGSGNWYQSEVYVCRTDEKGKKMDRRAMLVVELALGHESLHTFASHYAYAL